MKGWKKGPGQGGGGTAGVITQKMIDEQDARQEYYYSPDLVGAPLWRDGDIILAVWRTGRGQYCGLFHVHADDEFLSLKDLDGNYFTAYDMNDIDFFKVVNLPAADTDGEGSE